MSGSVEPTPANRGDPNLRSRLGAPQGSIPRKSSINFGSVCVGSRRVKYQLVAIPSRAQLYLYK